MFFCFPISRPGEKAAEAPPRPPPPNLTPIRPKRSVKPNNKKNVVEWFQQEELPKGICYDGDKILPYFHGENRTLLSLNLTGRSLPVPPPSLLPRVLCLCCTRGTVGGWVGGWGKTLRLLQGDLG